MYVQSPEPPGRFGLRLAVYPPSQVLQTDGRLYHLAPASRVVAGFTDSRVPLLRGRCSASLLLRTPPPPSPLRSLSRVLRLYGLPCSAAFATGGGGLLQLLNASLSPCCRYHPAEVENRVSQSSMLHAAFALSVAGSAFGAAHFRGHLCVRLRCGPVTRDHPYDDPVDGLQVIGFPPPCHPSYKASGFCLGGSAFPPNAPAFAGRTTRAERDEFASHPPATLLRTTPAA